MSDHLRQNGFYPRPFDEGYALTFTLREIYEGHGEFLSQHHDFRAACQAFARARRQASYAELRDTAGNVIADYVKGEGAQRSMPHKARDG